LVARRAFAHRWFAVPAGLIAAGAPRSLAGETSGENLALQDATCVLLSSADAEITARFDEGKVTGSAGCIGCFAGYEVDGYSITVSTMGMTMMACPESVMELEMAYASALAAVESFEISGTALEMIYDGGSPVFGAS
jgi:heat shock protein HslJ